LYRLKAYFSGRNSKDFGFFLLSYLVCSQIWLNYLMDDPHSATSKNWKKKTLGVIPSNHCHWAGFASILTLRSVLSWNNPQNSEMKFCGNMKLTCWKSS
jgi:hypothetical protein